MKICIAQQVRERWGDTNSRESESDHRFLKNRGQVHNTLHAWPQNEAKKYKGFT